MNDADDDDFGEVLKTGKAVLLNGRIKGSGIILVF
jgi:hypothetical protein